MLAMTDIALKGKRVMIRVDMNVPLSDGKVADGQRIEAHLATIRSALDAGAKLILLSHLGRPQEGVFDSKFSLQPVADKLSQLLAMEVPLLKDYLDGDNHSDAAVVLCENIRFQNGEKSNDSGLSKKLSELCDVFVMDAFGCAHRAHASTYGVAQYSDTACAGPLLQDEVYHLQAVLQMLRSHKASYSEEGKDLCIAVVGGAKVSSKIELMESFIGKVDVLIAGGGIANTFLAAMGHAVGRSLYEKDLLPFAKGYLNKASQSGTHLLVPEDVVCANEATEDAKTQVVDCDCVPDDAMILDIGPKTSAKISDVIQKARTILWNGPLGMFESKPFAAGTAQLAEAIGESPAQCTAGGGDTLLAIKTFKARDGEELGVNITRKGGYISTGGGSFMEFIQGKTLPAIEILEHRAQQEAGGIS